MARWTKDEIGAFESVIQGRVINGVEFPTDKKDWPRVVDWERLKKAVLTSGGSKIPALKKVFERPVSVLKTRYCRLKAQKAQIRAPIRKAWTKNEKDILKNRIESGLFGTIRRVQWGKLVKAHYENKRSLNSLQHAWKTMKPRNLHKIYKAPAVVMHSPKV